MCDHEHEAQPSTPEARPCGEYGRPIEQPTDPPWAERFPALFRERFEEYANADLTFPRRPARRAGRPAPPRRVGPRWPFLPGGTREPAR